MKDSEIIKALKEGIERANYIDCVDIGIFQNAIDLINRQKAEIEQWKEEANRYQNLWCIAVDDIEKSKSEAIKEFAERLKKKSWIGMWETVAHVDVDEIDNLIKEMNVSEDDKIIDLYSAFEEAEKALEEAEKALKGGVNNG